MPWWTDPQIKAAFWRPTVVLTHWLDYRLWPDSPALMHLHSVLWFGVLVAVVALLYRRLMPTTPWLAGMAALLYALDDNHGMPVGFLANRNVLPCVLFGVCALLAHDRWRRDRWRLGAVVGPLLLLLSLLSKEAGIATCAYLAAHALFLDTAPWRRRALAMLPYVAIVLAWRATWSYLGYGVADLGLYVDPLGEPVRFLAAVVERAPILLLGQWALPPAEMALVVPSEYVRLHWLCALGFLVILIAALSPLVRRSRLARFWALGMLLSLVPACTTFPADRLLFFVGIGATALLAQFWEMAFTKSGNPPPTRAWRRLAMPVAIIFGILHLALAPALLPVRAAYPAGPKMVETFHVRTPLDETVTQQDVIIVNAPSILHMAYFMTEREFARQPIPRRVRVLASGMQNVTYHRPDAHTLIVRPEKGFLAWRFEHLFRNHANPLAVGDTVKLTGVTAEVLEITPDKRPAEVAFRFAAALDSPSLRWLLWQTGEFRPFTPPAIGETTTVRPQ